MENIVWFENKANATGRKSEYDCTVSKRKKKGTKSSFIIVLKFRNGTIQTLNSDFIRVGLSKDGKRLYFAPAQKGTGWKLGYDGSSEKNTQNGPKRIQIGDTNLCDGLLRFLGEYDIEISDDDLLYIDSRNRK